MATVEIFTQYNPGPSEIVDFDPDEGMTKQEFKDECDINVIMDKYRDVGILPAGREASYGDFTSFEDFQTAQNTLAFAREQFEGLASEVRAKFDNSPGKFLEFVQSQKDASALEELGILSDSAVARLKAQRAAAAAQAAKDAADLAAARASAAAAGGKAS